MDVARKKGFTILEMIVVVATFLLLLLVIIIGVREFAQKGRETHLRTKLRDLQKLSQAIYLESSEGFKVLCAQQGGRLNEGYNSGLAQIQSEIDKIAGPNSLVCYADVDKYCISVEMHGVYLCIDSTGELVQTSTPCIDSNPCL